MSKSDLSILGYIILKAYYDIRVEIRRGKFGLISWLFEPLLYLAGFYFIFAVAFQRMAIDAVPSLLLGLLVWKWFSSSLVRISNSIKGNKHIFLRKKIPIWTFAASLCLSEMKKFMLAIIIFFVFSSFIFSGYLNINFTSFLVLVMLTSCFIFSLGFVLALILPFFAELAVIINSCLTVGLFVSGVIFDFSQVAPEKMIILQYNPMYQVISSMRYIVLEGHDLSVDTSLYLLIVSALLISLAILGSRLMKDVIWVQP